MDRRHFPSSMHAGSLFRIFTGGIALLAWFMAVYEPRSLSSELATVVDGFVLTVLLGVLGAMSIIDAVVNDIMPKKYHWRVALRQRHFILVAMAFCYSAQLYVAFYHLRSTGLLLYCLWNAFCLVAVAFVDAVQRSKDTRCALLTN